MAEERKEPQERRTERREDARRIRTDDQNRSEYVLEDGSLTSAAITGVAVALLNAELLPGMAIGVAAVMGPRLLPFVGSVLRPVLRTVVKAGYATFETAREVAAEANEQFQDMMAEARADYEETGEGVGQ